MSEGDGKGTTFGEAWKYVMHGSIFGDALMYARKIELWLYVAIYSEGGGGEGVRVM